MLSRLTDVLGKQSFPERNICMQNRFLKKRWLRCIVVTVLCLFCCMTVISAMIPENGVGEMLPGNENAAHTDNGSYNPNNAANSAPNGTMRSGNEARSIGDAARDAVSDAGNAAGDLIEGAGNAVNDAANGIGNAINSAGSAGNAGNSGSAAADASGGTNWILVLVLIVAAAAVFILLMSPKKSRN